MTDGEAETSDTMQEDVGIEVDNIEKGMGKDKIDAGKTEERKGNSVAVKRIMAAKTGKGKMDNVDVGTKHIRGNSVAVKWKMAEKTGKGKLKNLC
uniref:Uncharacterized protein n=1 Tax=Tanacetum cinerariifolium TaxID=118510 RepID=A0A699IEE9_TANCI|nr:hypothetical protein [Tanacetum cinerariifolium]